MMAFAVAAAFAAEIFVSESVQVERCVAAHAAALKQFPKVAADQLGLAIGRLDRVQAVVRFGQFQGRQPFYPASTVKLFYIAYGATLLDSKRLKMTSELERAFRDMIVDSSNDATGLILDSVTGTTGGPELSESDLKKWLEKRNAVNRWLKKLGIDGVNVNQKTWNEGPYGRERQGYGPNWENRNSLTAESGVRIMALVAMQKLVSKERNEWMKGYLSRKIPADSKDADFQSRAFVGAVLPAGSKLWSKAGYTDTVRMDIAWFQLPSGEEWVFSIFTKGQSNEPKLIPFVAENLLKSIGGEFRTGWRQSGQLME
jgi:beta-lactamase class A